MKKATLLVLAFVLVAVPLAFAEWGKAKTEAKSEEQVVARKQQMEQANREELASKEWTIYVTPKIARRNEPAEVDVLTFTGVTVKSRNLSLKGYSESNYALYVEPDGTAVWETMQGTQAGDTALLRGEIKGDALTGSISMQTERGDRTVYLFSSAIAQQAAPTTVKQGK
jgi:hypothetical protein